MGSTNSCFPSPVKSLHTLHHRRHRHWWLPTSKPPEQPINPSDVVNASDENKNAININQASEDEFIMLPGITRRLAQNIIEHRQKINGFKQIEDIALVNGIGADLFTRIRLDICVDVPRSSFTNGNKQLHQELVNINLGSYNDLRSVPGLTTVLIERIIRRRERKGSFRFVEDLLEIKGFDYMVLATVRPHVTVLNNEPKTPETLYPTLNRNNNNNNNNNNAADSLSIASLLLETLPPELQTILLASPPQRPSAISSPDKQLLRFASWNLQQLTNDKVRNPGVREVICRTILENNFSLIGIQEIGNKDALEPIIEELNNPTLPLIKDWPGDRSTKWKCTVSDVCGRMFQGSEYLGFIYDESAGIVLKKVSLLPFKAYFTRSPYIAIFRVHNRLDMVFVNVHLKARRLDEDENERTKDEALSLSILAEAMSDTVEQKHVIIFGDFNITPTASEFESLLQRNYTYVIGENTNISLKVPQGSTCLDNIWLAAEAKALSTGKSGVVRDNLSSMWIPAGWMWGGLVSDHCPIWTEFNII